MLGDQLHTCMSCCHGKYRPDFRCWILVLFEILSKKAAMIPARLGFVLQLWQNSVIPRANYVFPCVKIFRFLKIKILKKKAKRYPKKLLGYLFAFFFSKFSKFSKPAKSDFSFIKLQKLIYQYIIIPPSWSWQQGSADGRFFSSLDP